MTRNRWAVIIISICFGLAVFSSCAKKAALQENPTEKAAVAGKETPAGSDEEKAAREKAMREAELRDRERQQAEKEKASAASAQALPLAGFEYIYFDFDKYEIKPEARKTLQSIAEVMKANPGYALRIEGNCDERGTVEYNLALGERRAASAMQYLTALGIDENRISTISYGKEKPVDPGHNEAAWAKDRNDHFTVKQQGKENLAQK